MASMNSAGGGSAPLTPSGRIIERFTRYNDKQVLYEFEVHDPALYNSTDLPAPQGRKPRTEGLERPCRS